MACAPSLLVLSIISIGKEKEFGWIEILEWVGLAATCYLTAEWIRTHGVAGYSEGFDVVRYTLPLVLAINAAQYLRSMWNIGWTWF